MDGRGDPSAPLAAGSAAFVARGLDLPEQLTPWLESLEQSGPPPAELQLPQSAAAVELLTRLGVVEPDLTTIVDALPDPLQQPELWWLLERCCHVRAGGHWRMRTGWLLLS